MRDPLTHCTLIVTGDVFPVVVALGALTPGEKYTEAKSWTGG
jgi:hypothetical protein